MLPTYLKSGSMMYFGKLLLHEIEAAYILQNARDYQLNWSQDSQQLEKKNYKQLKKSIRSIPTHDAV